MMKAFVIPEEARTDTVELMQVPVPDIAADELLVRVKAVGVGIHDSYFLPPGISYPFPIGIEAAGVVEQVGSAVTGHAPGDRIAFVSSMQAKGGTWAEYAAVRADALIVSIPAGLDFVQAAAVPVAGNTIVRALHALPPLDRGASIFIAGASGAIGTFAVQLARARGWDVSASASHCNHEYLASLGASLAVDYHDADWTDQVRQWRPGGVDAALAVQPQTTTDSVSVVRDGGTVVTISGDDHAPDRPVTVVGVPYEIDVRDELISLMDQIVAGTIRLQIEQVHPFEQALDALEKVRTRHARGKIVLSLD